MFLRSVFDYIPERFQAPFITSMATLMGAFVGACVAQYFSHRLALIRENTKNTRDIYYQLFAPVIVDVYIYFDITTMFRKGHDLNEGYDENEIKEKIIEHVGSNLRIATPKLISSYHEVIKARYTFSGEGSRLYRAEIDFFLTFLKEIYSIDEKIKLFDEENRNDLIKNMIYFQIWKMIARKMGSFGSANVLAQKFFFENTKLNVKTYYELISFENNDLKNSSNFIGKCSVIELLQYLANLLINPSKVEDFMHASMIERYIGRDGMCDIFAGKEEMRVNSK